ncbi:hypothetical protein GM418_13850 [Maribellus comscasis]|uniref:Uncharacterized protein n=1 Tax=Maribellus comscasis TaxID=2681766 RepID=A0A6I6JUG4_9BACT|nr:hypothetical protein [Maribellus comscasis]QGY44710.1 hypothetical protein GM418_13850 [Maribellus comscasis]
MTTNETLKSKRELANRLVQEIIEIKENVESIKIDAEKTYSHIDLKDTEFKKLINSLNRINSTTEEAISNFRKERDRIKTLLTQANNFYDKKFLPLSEKIENKETGFRAKITSSNRELRELEKIKSDCSKQYDEIKKFVSEYKIKSRELSNINSHIRRLSETSEKNKNKTDSLLLKIQKADKEIQDFLTKNKSRNTETLSLEKNIKTRDETSKKLLAEIERLFNESNTKREEIQDVYEIAHETGLSGEFGNRRNNLKDSFKNWEKRILITSIILLVCLIGLFICQLVLYGWDIKDNNFDYNFYVRFLILSPIVYYLVFCSTQYSKVKKLHDKYSFKTTLAMTIKSHIELLTQIEEFQSPERTDKILDFIIEGFNKIYNEPYANDDFKMKVELANIKLDLQKNLLEKLNINKEK